MSGIVPVRFDTGDIVRTDIRQYIVGANRDDYRVFVEKETGKEILLASHALMNMVRSGRLTADAAYRAIDTDVLENRQVDFGAFTDLERDSALQKALYVGPHRSKRSEPRSS